MNKAGLTEFLVLVIVCTSLTITFGDNRDVTLLRATSDTIFFYIPCAVNSTCTLVENPLSTFDGVPLDLDAEKIENGIFAQRSLTSNSVYNITIRVNSKTGPRVSSIRASTCPETHPVVDRLRVAAAGPGWMDVRWRVHRDTQCRSDFIYFVRYGAENEPVGPWMLTGIFKDNGKEIFRPLHPCQAWPDEYCIILSDRVQPAKKHKIEVVAMRYDSTANVSTLNIANFPNKVEVLATSNASLVGKYSFGDHDLNSPCASPAQSRSLLKPDVASSTSGNRQGRSQEMEETPMWLIALMVGSILTMVIFAGLMAYKIWKKKRKERENLKRSMPTGPSPPDICPSKLKPPNIDQSRPLPGIARVSDIYDDCQDVQQSEMTYERLTICNPITNISKLPTEHLPTTFSNAQEARSFSNFENDNTYVPMAPTSLIYDDAQEVIQRSKDVRQSEDYVAPRQVPTYTEVLEEDVHSPGYNRPYSTMTTDRWKGWT